MRLLSTHRRWLTVIVGTLGVIALSLSFSASGLHFLRGSLVEDERVLTLLHGDKSARNMRKGISAAIRGIALHNLTFDLNDDGIVDRTDLKLYIKSIRALLASSCGNGVREAGEECDDGNQNNNDSCMNSCVLAKPSLEIGIAGPVSMVYDRNVLGANLGNIVLSSSGRDILIQNLFILVQGQAPNGQSFKKAGVGTDGDDVNELIENIRLLDTDTNQTYQGIRLDGMSDASNSPLQGSGAYQVYRIDNLEISDSKTFSFLVDTLNTGILPNGSMFTIHLCAELKDKMLLSGQIASNDAPCSLGGFFQSWQNLAYKIKAIDAQSSATIITVSPHGTLSGNTMIFTRLCGNGIKDNAEQCDDHNPNDGDGCSYMCTIETGFHCEGDTLSACASYNQQVLALADMNPKNGIVSDEEALALELDVRDAEDKPYDEVKQFDLDHDGTIDTERILTELDNLSSIKDPPNLYVSKSATPVKPHQLIGGALGDEILRLELHADKGSVDVTNLVFSAFGDNASTHATNVDHLELYTVGATVPFSVATSATCGSDTVPPYSMCAKMDNHELTITNDLTVNLLVRPRMHTDIDGAVSGQFLAYRLDATGTPVRARSIETGNSLNENNGNAIPEGEVIVGNTAGTANTSIASNTNQVVLTKIASITNADPNQNGTSIPTGTRRAIGQFKFALVPSSNVKNGLNTFNLSDIVFNINATNVLLGSGDQTNSATSDFTLYNKADLSGVTCTANVKTASGSSFIVTCPTIGSSSMNAEIDPGNDAIFVLQADVLNAKILNESGSLLQVSLRNFTDNTASSFGSSNSHMRWLDKDNGASTSFLWIEYPDTSVNGTSYNG